MTLTDLSPEQLVALTKLIPAKAMTEARDAVASTNSAVVAKGTKTKDVAPLRVTLPIDPFTITVSGSVDVNPRESYTPTVALPLLDLVAQAMHVMGFQRELFFDVLADVANTALSNGGKVGDEAKATVTDMSSKVKDLQAAFKSNLDDKERMGKTFWTVEAKVE